MYTDHWVYKYIGFKWTINYNCFDHFCHVQKLQFKVEGLDKLKGMPDFEERSEALAFIRTCKDLSKWKEIHPNMVKEGDAVLFGASKKEIQILIEGPENQDYWDCWAYVVDNIRFTFDGIECTLFEDNDLWAVPVN